MKECIGKQWCRAWPGAEATLLSIWKCYGIKEKDETLIGIVRTLHIEYIYWQKMECCISTGRSCTQVYLHRHKL
jgi:hypothetical protein